MSAAPFRPEHIERLLGYVRGWATTELLTGLLAHPDLLSALADGASLDRLESLSGLDERPLTALLHALALEDVVEHTGGAYRLTEFGRALVPMRGFMELFTLGYPGFFRHADVLWGGTVDPAWRDMDQVGRASVAISEWGALPMTTQAVLRHRPGANTIVDVGCANGRSLIRLCELLPGIHGIALEPDADLSRHAEQLVAEAGLEDRVTVVNATAESWRPEAPVDVFVFGFVLQELVDDAAVVTLLEGLHEGSPDAAFVVIEVDAAGWETERVGSHAHGLGYYNPYYLLHGLTAQRLRSVDRWIELFAEAGLRVIDTLTVDGSVDPTGNEVAIVLDAVH